MMASKQQVRMTGERVVTREISHEPLIWEQLFYLILSMNKFSKFPTIHIHDLTMH